MERQHSLSLTVYLLNMSLSPSPARRVKGVVAIGDHICQRGGNDHLRRSDHVHFPTMCLLYHQGNLSLRQRHRPLNDEDIFFKVSYMNNNNRSSFTHTEDLIGSYTHSHTHTYNLWHQIMIKLKLFCNFRSLPSPLILCVYVCVCVQALYVVLPGLLDCNPFPVDSSEPCWKGGVGFPEPVRRVLQVSTSCLVNCYVRTLIKQLFNLSIRSFI